MSPCSMCAVTISHHACQKCFAEHVSCSMYPLACLCIGPDASLPNAFLVCLSTINAAMLHSSSPHTVQATMLGVTGASMVLLYTMMWRMTVPKLLQQGFGIDSHCCAGMASASSKPPLKRSNGISATQAGPSGAANPESHTFEEEEWWDPTDASKVRPI